MHAQWKSFGGVCGGSADDWQKTSVPTGQILPWDLAKGPGQVCSESQSSAAGVPETALSGASSLSESTVNDKSAFPRTPTSVSDESIACARMTLDWGVQRKPAMCKEEIFFFHVIETSEFLW